MNSIVKLTCAATACVTMGIAAAGCGDGSDSGGGGVPFAKGGPPKGTPSSAEVVGCLQTAGRKTGFTVSDAAADLDSVAKRATDRAVAIDAGGEKSIVIFDRTEKEAASVVDQYRSGPIDERGAAYAQSGTIVIVDKGAGPQAAQRKAIVDCTKYGTKEQDGGGTAAAPPAPPPPPPPVDLEANNARVYDRSEVADADFGTVQILKVQDPRPGKSPFLPKAGTRFIGVTFKLMSRARLGYRGFVLYGKNDKEYFEVPDPDAFSAATLDKGETKRGLMIFEVPKSVKASTLRFHVDAPLGADDSIEIRLK